VKFENDSIRLFKKNESILKINKILNEQNENASQIEKENVRLILENKNLKDRNQIRILAEKTRKTTTIINNNQRIKIISLDLEKRPIEFVLTFIAADGELLSNIDLNLSIKINHYNEPMATRKVDHTTSFDPLTGKFKILLNIDNLELNKISLNDLLLISPQKIVYPEIYPDYMTKFNRAISFNIISSELIITLPNHYKKEYIPRGYQKNY